ncbi:hypothetical protein CBS101457_000280 [Exobasidium rhododendri]|nr:hypothetical protein CBS101457_000280 [Exobasidium rhododendri]
MPTSSGTTPTYYDNLFHRHPEGIAAHNHPGNEAGSSHSYNPTFHALDLNRFSTDEGLDSVHGSSSSSGRHLWNTEHQQQFYDGLQQGTQIGAQSQEIQQNQWDEAENVNQPQLPQDNVPPAENEAGFQLQMDDLVWPHRSVDAKNKLIEIVSKYRGLRADMIAQTLEVALTKRLENGLSSSNKFRVRRALSFLWPITPRTMLPLWMEGVSDAGCDVLVNRMAYLSGQPKDVVRNRFLTTRMDSDMTKFALQNGDGALLALARQSGLGIDGSVIDEHGQIMQKAPRVGMRGPRKGHNWFYGLEQGMKSKVVEILKRTCGKESNWVYQALKEPRIPLAFGLALAHYEGEEFQALIEFLLEDKALPEWYDQFVENVQRAVAEAGD